ncbi:RusA family crossover junction endodeoxyribonuclease [Chromobacterium haemolyticum]|uniref:RusA family crossover junction endodeoxyribonuclease n=1 Tax=Chromobacterium haemolyticum TaxID=394935 RepID=A0ABS3GQR2_9NEIS|nr:RusA family crossover junction endodeoxyribonuclease [Chromobacterium haemolyticum]MBK0415212.1 RusA family crossover junction endodeoxyribonuclease [Chromobacterium haemolyticum]MBO0416573.1 RusA family crossover junction endodeoxyribonuclease [Chromobacterium haemolyticum]MBO0499851.1 RusA family crossover junction endodeoxyribonuclease [Chromobacterium haemolyticum]
MNISFFVPGAPVGKGRPKVSSRGGKFARMYTPEKTANYESLIALAAQEAMAGNPLIAGPADVEISMFLPVPTSWSKKKQAAALQGQVYPTKKPDADNVIKAIFDGINGVVWVDDVQACDIVVRKRYADKPGVEVTVREIAGALFAA